MPEPTPDMGGAPANITPEYVLSQGYGIMPNVVLFDTDLSSGAKLLYCYLNALSAATGECYPKNKHLAEKFGVSTRTITNLLAELIDKEYALLRTDENTTKRYILLYARGTKKTSRGVENNFVGGRKSATEITDTIIKTNSNNKYTDTELRDLDRLYTLYLIKHKIDPQLLDSASEQDKRSLLESARSRYKLTDQRKAKVVARLRDAGYDLTAKAIVNVSKSEWHMGSNPDGKKYNDLTEFICRNYEQVEKWGNQ